MMTKLEDQYRIRIDVEMMNDPTISAILSQLYELRPPRPRRPELKLHGILATSSYPYFPSTVEERDRFEEIFLHGALPTEQEIELDREENRILGLLQAAVDAYHQSFSI